MRIQPISNARPINSAAAAAKTGATQSLAQPAAPQANYQPPEVERMKSSRRAVTLRAPETGKGTVVDIMG